MMDTNGQASVPLVAPSPRYMKAPALWVTIANWAEALATRFGSAQIVTPDGSIPRQVARDYGAVPSMSGAQAPLARRTSLEGIARMLASDVRRCVRAARSGAHRPSAPQAMVPLVWQHHDVFHVAGLRMAGQLQVPSVLFVHAPQVWEARKWGVLRPGWGNMLERVGEVPQFRGASLIACVSEEVRDAVCARGGSPERTVVTPCTAPLTLPAMDGGQLRTRLGIDDAFVVGWVGSFRMFHGLEILVDACRSADVGERLVLLFVGDGAQRQAIASRCKAAGVEAIFTGGLAQDDVFAHMAAFDCGVVTASPSATFHYSPLKLKEYLAAGVSVVAPRIGEMKRVLAHEQTAMLYDVTDVDGLARSLEKLAANPSLRTALTAAGRRLSEREFSIRRQVDEVVERLADRTRA